MAFSMVHLKIHSVIKGYDVYKVKSMVGTVCKVEKEVSKYPKALVVKDGAVTVGHVPATHPPPHYQHNF